MKENLASRNPTANVDEMIADMLLEAEKEAAESDLCFTPEDVLKAMRDAVG